MRKFRRVLPFFFFEKEFAAKPFDKTQGREKIIPVLFEQSEVTKRNPAFKNLKRVAGKLSKNAAKPLKLNFWGLAVLAAALLRRGFGGQAGGEMRPNYFQYTQPSFAKATEWSAINLTLKLNGIKIIVYKVENSILSPYG